jgi:hypothetical protein
VAYDLPQDRSPIQYWRLLDVKSPLPSFAILILSFTCNSAGAEQFFSITGNIKTKKRNRLSVEKLQKTSVVKPNLLSKQAQMGHRHKRLKRSFNIESRHSLSSVSLSTAGGLAAEEETADLILDESDGMEIGEGSGNPSGGTSQYRAMEWEMLQNLNQVNSLEDIANIQITEDVSSSALHRPEYTHLRINRVNIRSGV